MNKKGQALVEFVIILPIMMMLIFCVIDFGRLISYKNTIDKVAIDSATLYESGKNIEEIKEIEKKVNGKTIKIDMEKKDGYTFINVTDEINPITPGLDHFSKKLFLVKSSRVVKDD